MAIDFDKAMELAKALLPSFQSIPLTEGLDDAAGRFWEAAKDKRLSEDDFFDAFGDKLEAGGMDLDELRKHQFNYGDVKAFRNKTNDYDTYRAFGQYWALIFKDNAQPADQAYWDQKKADAAKPKRKYQPLLNVDPADAKAAEKRFKDDKADVEAKSQKDSPWPYAPFDLKEKGVLYDDFHKAYDAVLQSVGIDFDQLFWPSGMLKARSTYGIIKNIADGKAQSALKRLWGVQREVDGFPDEASSDQIAKDSAARAAKRAEIDKTRRENFAYYLNAVKELQGLFPGAKDAANKLIEAELTKKLAESGADVALREVNSDKKASDYLKYAVLSPGAAFGMEVKGKGMLDGFGNKVSSHLSDGQPYSWFIYVSIRTGGDPIDFSGAAIEMSKSRDSVLDLPPEDIELKVYGRLADVEETLTSVHYGFYGGSPMLRMNLKGKAQEVFGPKEAKELVDSVWEKYVQDAVADDVKKAFSAGQVPEAAKKVLLSMKPFDERFYDFARYQTGYATPFMGNARVVVWCWSKSTGGVWPFTKSMIDGVPKGLYGYADYDSPTSLGLDDYMDLPGDLEPIAICVTRGAYVWYGGHGLECYAQQYCFSYASGLKEDVLKKCTMGPDEDVKGQIRPYYRNFTYDDPSLNPYGAYSLDKKRLKAGFVQVGSAPEQELLDMGARLYGYDYDQLDDKNYTRRYKGIGEAFSNAFPEHGIYERYWADLSDLGN